MARTGTHLVVLKQTDVSEMTWSTLQAAGGPDAILVLDLRLIELLRDFPKSLEDTAMQLL